MPKAAQTRSCPTPITSVLITLLTYGKRNRERRVAESAKEYGEGFENHTGALMQ
jgi:hypothetical protein